ncbi:MAG: M14 family zinc carboxypeptidase [Cetobacterium sp.]|uniref:M14 family zinc carboxypeptidase n=1 Tax=Cetobacterium sp. TaxID=2071632 RepID=UPI003F2D5B3F
MKTTFLLILLVSTSILSFSYKEPENIKKFFPQPNLTIETPSVKNDHFTTQREMLNYLGAVRKSSTKVEVNLLGPTNYNNYLPIFIIGKKATIDPKKLTIMIIGQQHGNEPMSCDIAMGTIKRIASGDLEYLLDNLNFIIMPRINPDGAQDFERTNSSGIDINNDHSLLETREAQLVNGVFSLYNPHIVIDLHEYIANKESYKNLSSEGVVPYFDALLMHPTNPNSSKELTKDLINTYISPLINNKNLTGFTYSYYYNPFNISYDGNLQLMTPTGSHALARNAYSLKGALTLLIELRGRDIDKENIPRRLETGIKTLEFILTNVSKRSNSIKTLIENNQTQKNKTFITQWILPPYESTIPLISIEKGELISFPCTKYSFENISSLANTKIPNYYLIPSNEEDAIALLKAHSKKYFYLKNNENFTVEEYHLKNKDFNLITVSKDFPKGTLVLPIENNQDLFISSILEPLSPNSFFQNNILKTKDNILPLYRYHGNIDK